MKKPKEVYLLQDKLIKFIEEINMTMYMSIKTIKKEYKNNLIDEKNKLLLEIAEGEKLDINMLRKKYLKPKEISNKNISSQDTDEELLDMIIVNDIIYYYENKENGKVFDKNSKIVGNYINSKILLNVTS